MNSSLPIQPQLQAYLGSNAKKQRAQVTFNRLAQEVADCCNRKIANDTSDTRTIYFGEIAQALGIDVDLVWKAISMGDRNGRFGRVTPAHREALEPLKTPT